MKTNAKPTAANLDGKLTSKLQCPPLLKWFAALCVLNSVEAFSATPPQCTAEQCAYLGTGYNIIGGDPNAKSIAPGWTYRIFDREWIIANAQGFDINVCSYDSQVTSISGGRSAQENLLTEMTISGSAEAYGAKIAFTGSHSVNFMNESAWSESKHFEEARASCELFVAKLPPFSAGGFSIKFAEDFNASVYSLPSKKYLNSSEKDSSSDEKLENWMRARLQWAE